DDSFVSKLHQQIPVERPYQVIKPPTPEVVAKTPITTAQITVNFATGRHDLDSMAQSLIAEKIALLPKTFSGAYVRVEGNTDSVGTDTQTPALSARRAKWVINSLVPKFNLPKAQSTAVGKGPNKPTASNDARDGRAQNRRTDVAVVAR